MRDERTRADLRVFALNHKKLTRVPLGNLVANPSLAVRLRVVPILPRAAIRFAFRVPLADEYT
jgi:hypothetical protein